MGVMSSRQFTPGACFLALSHTLEGDTIEHVCMTDVSTHAKKVTFPSFFFKLSIS
jgi:hypothetical protein